MAGAPVFLSHPSSLDHDPGPHPEQPARIAAIERALAARHWLGYHRLASPPVQRTVLEAVHPSEYVAAIERLCASGGGRIDADTAVSPGSFTAALHGSGGAVALAEMLVAGEAPTGFSAHRPPGHHAPVAQAMGFCLFNHVAVAARHAVDRLGLARVMIVDWDVHHGNGTNDIFLDSDEVLFVSIHQSPLYPGTGPASEVGTGAGEGFTVNLPVPPGSGDAVYAGLIEHVVAPLVRTYEPQLVLASAGFDAHRDDPLAECEVSDEGFAEIARGLAGACADVGAPLGAILEGGYALDALARSVLATLSVLDGARGAGGGAGSGVAPGPEAIAARERLRRWWAL